MHLFEQVEPLDLPRVIIFDYDGTLSDGRHRLHLLPTKDLHLVEAWHEFNSMCHLDAPIRNTIDVMNAMYDAGFYVIILTGRSCEFLCESIKWLKDNGARYHMIQMRAADDNRKDTVIKEEFLRNRIGLDNIVACWDDSPNVIAHFRSLGLTCYAVVDYGCTASRTDLHSNGVDSK